MFLQRHPNPLPQSILKKQNLQDSTQKHKKASRAACFLSAGAPGQTAELDCAATVNSLTTLPSVSGFVLITTVLGPLWVH